METSSPLAAIRPAPPAFGQGNLFGPSLGPSPLGPGSMNIFQRQNPEYFNIKAVRGSSPAASLAADLSQNFKLNEASSPMFPTPRRALFTTAAMMDGFKSREYLTTPPLAPSSSPGNADMMDMSPLPQKGAFVSHVEVPSPTPSIPMSDDMMMESPLPQKTSMDPSKAIGAEARRKLDLMRPSLNRAKGYTTGAIPGRSNADNYFPSVKFGSEVQLGSSPSTSMSLSECFQDSPPQQRRLLGTNGPCLAMAGTRPKHQFNLGLSGVRNGSPISHTRKSSNTRQPRRAMNRRSLSMFESADEIIKPKEPAAPSTLYPVPDEPEPQVPILPHCMPEDERDNIPRISRSTLLEVLDGKYSDKYQHKMIIDCRFEYEYEGGHIDGAINYNDKELLADHLFRTPMEGNVLLIFHCEYSAHRAPLMACHIRKADRRLNLDQYPILTYPDVYILEGGYSGFFSEHQERCYPQAYVEMNAAGHEKTCEREMGRLKQQRRGLGRAQTYAFGDRIQDSPTAPGRGIGRDCEFADLAGSPCGGERPPRRMVSF
ncbi:putative M-phase inducer phosphatase [Triangularia verruculosa]|uniref:M-phase inducer phosphatase n=1 Tax=Triangularia verruculosa TaxID=2587418 RepID=A0AAN6XGJ0_9PEZI|nr:putative M-phase inducer phosphatase [Triangularia verruculosa]